MHVFLNSNTLQLNKSRTVPLLKIVLHVKPIFLFFIYGSQATTKYLTVTPLYIKHEQASCFENKLWNSDRSHNN